MTAVYLDASAIVKLVTPEDESEPLAAYLQGRDRRFITSSLARAEVGRAARAARATEKALDVLAQFDERPITRNLLDAAGALDVGRWLRTLDAIHLVTALELRPELDALVTYDRRMADAAEALGLPVVAPA